jgi:putative redox protein
MQKLIIPAGELQLAAMLHAAPSGPGRPLMVLCHGFCGSADGGSSLELADALQKQDTALLRFWFTPHCCLSQQLAEIAAVIDFVRRNFTRKIVLAGRSMGAAAALAFAARDRHLSGLCLMACPADLPSTFRGILRDDYERLKHGEAITVLHEGAPVHLTPDFIGDLSRYDLPADIRSLAGLPVLIIHGLTDATVPVAHARQLFDAAGEPKQLLLLPDHGHSFIGTGDRFIPTVSDWLRRQVFPPSL